MIERKQISLQKDDTQAALDALAFVCRTLGWLEVVPPYGDAVSRTKECDTAIKQCEKIRAALTAQLTKTDDNVSCPSVANTGDINADLLEALKKRLPYDEIELIYSNCYLSNERIRGYNEAIDDCIKAIARAEQKGQSHE